VQFQSALIDLQASKSAEALQRRAIAPGAPITTLLRIGFAFQMKSKFIAFLLFWVFFGPPCFLISQSSLIEQSAASQVPHLIPYSGYLLDESGKPIKVPTEITFAIYKEQQGGPQLWIEIQNVNPNTHGEYSVLLGSSSADGVPQDIFNTTEARWIGATANGGVEQPRVMLISAPYALKAADTETLGGLPASAFLQAGSSSTQALQGPPGPIGPQGPAGANGTNGIGFNFRSAFDPSASYAENDVAIYNGSTYLAKAENQGPNNITPDKNPAWNLMAGISGVSSDGANGLSAQGSISIGQYPALLRFPGPTPQDPFTFENFDVPYLGVNDPVFWMGYNHHTGGVRKQGVPLIAFGMEGNWQSAPGNYTFESYLEMIDTSNNTVRENYCNGNNRNINSALNCAWMISPNANGYFIVQDSSLGYSGAPFFKVAGTGDAYLYRGGLQSWGGTFYTYGAPNITRDSAVGIIAPATGAQYNMILPAYQWAGLMQNRGDGQLYWSPAVDLRPTGQPLSIVPGNAQSVLIYNAANSTINYEFDDNGNAVFNHGNIAAAGFQTNDYAWGITHPDANFYISDQVNNTVQFACGPGAGHAGGCTANGLLEGYTLGVGAWPGVTTWDASGVKHEGGTAPTSDTGTLTGTNAGGYVSGLSAATSVTITFANSGWNTWASCVANTNVPATQPYVSSISKSAVTFTFASLTGTLYYSCNGN
jgi:hypothetical protein